MNGFILHQWPRYERWVFRVAVLILLVMLAQGLAQLVWQLFTPVTTPDVATPAPFAAPATATSSSRPQITASTTQLFGAADTVAVPAASAPETQLDLKLIGVFATGDSSALAIIAPGRRAGSIYAIGDDLPGGAVLRAIYPDRVLLERGGSLETLKLPQESLGGMIEADTGSPRGGFSATGDLAQQLGQYRREAMRNPARMAEFVDAQPVQQGGRFVGYRLNLRQDMPVFTELGLRSGDVVTEVNGIALDKPEAGIRALRQLATARELNLTVMRNGRPETIQANFAR